MKQRQLIYKDSFDPECKEEENYGLLNYFEAMGEMISRKQYQYRAFGAGTGTGTNSNTAMRVALTLTARAYPKLSVPRPKYSAPGWDLKLPGIDA